MKSQPPSLDVVDEGAETAVRRGNLGAAAAHFPRWMTTWRRDEYEVLIFDTTASGNWLRPVESSARHKDRPRQNAFVSNAPLLLQGKALRIARLNDLLGPAISSLHELLEFDWHSDPRLPVHSPRHICRNVSTPRNGTSPLCTLFGYPVIVDPAVPITALLC